MPPKMSAGAPSVHSTSFDVAAMSAGLQARPEVMFSFIACHTQYTAAHTPTTMPGRKPARKSLPMDALVITAKRIMVMLGGMMMAMAPDEVMRPSEKRSAYPLFSNAGQ